MILKEMISVYNDKTVRYSNIDVACQKNIRIMLVAVHRFVRYNYSDYSTRVY